MVTKVVDGLWQIECRTLDQPNVYLVQDDDLTLVDAGWPGDGETVRQGVVDAGFSLADVDRVLLTHYDIDHTGGLSRLPPALDAPVYIHPTERPYLRGGERPPLSARHGLEALHSLLARTHRDPKLPIRPVSDGDTIGGLRAFHTPGHTPGHVTYIHEGCSAAFLGDLVMGWGDELRPTTSVTNYDSEELRASSRRLVTDCPRFEYACPGHGPVLEDGYEKLAALDDT